MKITKILGFVLLFTACGVILQAADCSSITDTSKRFDPLKDGANYHPLMQVISAGIDPDEEIFTNEIRRPDQMGVTAGDSTGATKRLQLKFEMDPSSTADTPVYKLDANGQKIALKDTDNNPIPIMNGTNYVWGASTGMVGLDKIEKIKRDADENPILDSEGNPQVELENGKIVWESGQDVQNRVLKTSAQSPLVDRPRMSVGLWCPFVEPAPVVRAGTQLDGTKARIYHNSNAATKGEYQFVVKDLTVDPVKFYVYKDVKYKWKFEQSGRDGKAEDEVVSKKATATTAEEKMMVPINIGEKNNDDGESGAANWTPFFEYTKTISEASNFLAKFGADQPAPLTDKKVYANHHTTAYDTGISSVQSTSQSNILQAVTMTLSYKRAAVEGTAEGNGYPDGPSGTADPINDTINFDSSKFDLTPEKVASLTFEVVNVENPVPADYAGVIEDDGVASGTKMWPDVMGKATAYKLVYVEDYKEPDSPPVEYKGGTAAGKYFYKAYLGGTIDRDIIIGYSMPNPKLQSAASQESGVKLKYYVGNGDIYRVDNPFFGSTSYGTDESKTRPYLTFFYMRGNNMFGPYACPVPLGKVKEWYTKRQSFWKTTANGGTKTPAETLTFVTEKMRNALPSSTIPKWQMGYVFYIMGTDASGGDAIPLTKDINDSWRKGSVAENTRFNNFLTILNETKGSNPAAQYAFECVTEFKKFIEAPTSVAPAKLQPPATFKGQDFRKFFRFALAGFDPMQGSFCVGPQELEKDNPAVIVEKVINVAADADDPAADVLTGTLTVHLERMIMPSNYVNDAKDECSLDVYGSKQTVSVAVGGCCGAITTVTPGVENTRQGTEIVDNVPEGSTDNAGVGLPVPQLSVSDSGGEKGISVPATYEMQAGETLYVVDKATNQPVGAGSDGVAGQYAAGTFTGEPGTIPGNFSFDTSKYGYAIVPPDAAGNPGNVAQAVPISYSEGGAPGDLLLSEDERVAITTGGYDNVDHGSKGMGVGKAQLLITNLQTNLPENLEYVDANGVKQTPADGKIVIAPTSNSLEAMFAFDPRIQIFHIFRDPGKYKAEYTVWESSYAPPPVTTPPQPPTLNQKSRTLSFNIIVKDVKQQNRAIEDRNSRQ